MCTRQRERELTMDEYVKKSEAINAVLLRMVSSDNEDTDLYNTALRRAASAIYDIPAADARPVVLCRDCDCWNDWDSAGKESLGNYVCSCAHWSVEDGPVLYTGPDDFCSYGEKREES